MIPKRNVSQTGVSAVLTFIFVQDQKIPKIPTRTTQNKIRVKTEMAINCKCTDCDCTSQVFKPDKDGRYVCATCRLGKHNGRIVYR